MLVAREARGYLYACEGRGLVHVYVCVHNIIFPVPLWEKAEEMSLKNISLSSSLAFANSEEAIQPNYKQFTSMI